MVLRFKSGENFAAVGSQFMIAAASTFIILVLALTCSDLLFDQIQRFVPIDNPWTIMAVLISLSFLFWSLPTSITLRPKSHFRNIIFVNLPDISQPDRSSDCNTIW